MGSGGMGPYGFGRGGEDGAKQPSNKEGEDGAKQPSDKEGKEGEEGEEGKEDEEVDEEGIEIDTFIWLTIYYR